MISKAEAKDNPSAALDMSKDVMKLSEENIDEFARIMA
jgi:hypothetical protein